MAESAQDRHLPASQRKIQKAREDGQVARSRDLGHFAAVAGGGALLVALAPAFTGWLRELITRGLTFNNQSLAGTAPMVEHLGEATLRMMALVLPLRHCAGCRGAGGRRAVRRLELDLEADRAEVRQVQPADRPGPRLLQAAARRNAEGLRAGARARHDRRAVAALACDRVCADAGAAAARGDLAKRDRRCKPACCCSSSRSRRSR